jgi:LacI family transcriptional regulator
MARVTLADIAVDAGVSKATVSLVLRESPLVAASTRAKVQASMARLGYVYHRGAASLRSRRSHTVGLVVTEVANPFFAEFTVGAEARLTDAGITVLLGHNYESTAKQRNLIQVMREHGVDGLMLTPAEGTLAEELAPLLVAKVPHLLVTRYVSGHDAPYVGADNVAGARRIAEHVLEHGARRVSFLGGLDPSSSRQDRRRGVEQALAARRRKLSARLSIPSAATRQAGYAAAVDVLAQPSRPDAIICYNDVVAFGVLLACERRGLVVGRDIIVTGFDDIAESALQHPGLTTAGSNPRELGRRAAEMLLTLIESPNSVMPDAIVDAPLIVRGSCGCEHERAADHETVA